MKNVPFLVLSMVVAVALVGCTDKPKTTEAGGKTDTPVGTTPAAAPAPKVPDALKTDGYYYYGLDNTKPLTYTYTDGTSKPADGVQTVQLKGVDKDANFTISRTGALTNMGDEDLLVKSDGVYLTRSSWGPVEPAMLSFPSKATEGYSWKTSSKMKGEDDRAVTLEGTWTIGKPEKITVAAGTFDTVTMTGVGTMSVEELPNDKASTKTPPAAPTKHPLLAQGWFSRELGEVKLVVKSKDAKGQDKTLVVELKKVG